jgi:hypothetical protein
MPEHSNIDHFCSVVESVLGGNQVQSDTGFEDEMQLKSSVFFFFWLQSLKICPSSCGKEELREGMIQRSGKSRGPCLGRFIAPEGGAENEASPENDDCLTSQDSLIAIQLPQIC